MNVGSALLFITPPPKAAVLATKRHPTTSGSPSLNMPPPNSAEFVSNRQAMIVGMLEAPVYTPPPTGSPYSLVSPVPLRSVKPSRIASGGSSFTKRATLPPVSLASITVANAPPVENTRIAFPRKSIDS